MPKNTQSRQPWAGYVFTKSARAYTEKQKQKIKRVLAQPCGGKINCQFQDKNRKGDDWMENIEAAAAGFMTYREYEKDMPKGKQVKEQLQDLERKADQLCKAISGLDHPAEYLLGSTAISDLQRWPSPNETFDTISNSGKILIALIEEALEHFNPRTGLRTVSPILFVDRLANIWAEAHGHNPTRRVNLTTDPPEDYGPFHDFAQACAAPFKLKKVSVDHLMRRVLNCRKRGVPII